MKKIYKITGMDCPSCALVIESDLEDAGLPGKCNFGRETLEIDLPDQETEAKVKIIVETAGYSLEQ